MIFFLTAFDAQAQKNVTPPKTNSIPDAIAQGQALANKMLDQLMQVPAQGQTNTGVFSISDGKGHHWQVPLTVKIMPEQTHWETVYEAQTTNGLETITIDRGPDRDSGSVAHRTPQPTSLTNMMQMLDESFAGTEFTVGDLDLAFLGWPDQKVLRREVHRSCGCTVLQSTNPHPGTNGYYRVEAWIDNDSLGIVEAEAYDANGKELKDFEPKNLEKIDGQYQVQSMVMKNEQTGARTKLEFDLKK